MANFNKVLLMGNLTRDPEMRYTQSGTAVAKMGLAVNRRYRNKSSNEWVEETTFVDVEAWGSQAETINQYMRKGRPIFIEGRLRLDSWEGRDGQKRNKLMVVLENFQFINSGGSGGGGGGSDNGGRSASDASRDPGGGEQQVQAGRVSDGASQQGPRPQGEDLNFDDIPF